MTETYHCPQCEGKNVCQEESLFWNLNTEDYVKDSGHMNDFFWCRDCDEKIPAVVVKEDCQEDN